MPSRKRSTPELILLSVFEASMHLQVGLMPMLRKLVGNKFGGSSERLEVIPTFSILRSRVRKLSPAVTSTQAPPLKKKFKFDFDFNLTIAASKYSMGG
jgi:hypothetical protein